MGIEFIRSKGGKSYLKRWADGLDRTKRPQLIDFELIGESRSLTAVLGSGMTVTVGATVIVEAHEDGDLLISDGLKSFARVRLPPASVKAALAQQHGMAKATVSHVSSLSHMVELTLK